MSLGSFLGGVVGTINGATQTVSTVASALGADTSQVSALESRALNGDAAAYQQLQTLAHSSNLVTSVAASAAVSRIDTRRAAGNVVASAAGVAGQVATAAQKAAVGLPYIAEQLDPSRPSPMLTWVVIGAGVLVLVLVLRRSDR